MKYYTRILSPEAKSVKGRWREVVGASGFEDAAIKSLHALKPGSFVRFTSRIKRFNVHVFSEKIPLHASGVPMVTHTFAMEVEK